MERGSGDGSGATNEATAARRDAWLRLVASFFPAQIWATDRELQILATLENPGRGGLPLDELAARAEAGEGSSLGAVRSAHHCALSGTSATFDVRWRRRSYRGQIDPTRDHAGRITGCVGVAVDETERERRLADVERHLVETQAVAHVGSWEWDVDSDRYAWSDELYHLFGLRRGEAEPTRQAFLALVHPDDLERAERASELVLSQPEPVEHDLRIVRPDGVQRTLHMRMEAFPADGAAGRRVVGISQDVTEQRAADARLTSALSLLEATLESTADGLLVVDRNRHIVKNNARFAAIWQIPESVIRTGEDARALAFVSDKAVDPEAFFARIEELYRAPEAESRDEVALRDGRTLERYSQPQRIDGKPVGRVWSFRDVSEQRRAEAARDRLLSSECAARQAAHAAAERAALLAEASRLLTSLDHESALASLAELVASSFADCCAVDMLEPGGGMQRVGAAPGNHAELPYSAFQPTTTLHEQAHLAVLGVPLSIAGRIVGVMRFGRDRARGFSPADLAVAEDLAGRAALATEIARLYAETRAALYAREEFLSMAAHELRTPLAALQATTDGLLAGVYTTPIAPDHPLHRPLRSIGRQVRRLAAVVSGLLDAIDVSTDGIGLDLAESDLSAIAAAVVARFRADVGPKADGLSLSTPGPIVGRWDRRRLDQVTATLISNALRYGAGKPIQIAVERRGDAARLTVQDHGVGIPPERLPTVFGRFDRAGAPRSWGGLGLGLYNASAIVARHRGHIRVESRPGEGSTFIVEIPLSGPEERA